MVDAGSTQGTIHKILVTTMEVDAGLVHPAVSLSGLDLDSLALMELSVQLEDVLDVQIDASKLINLTVSELVARVVQLRERS